jgi:hypothetical protein
MNFAKAIGLFLSPGFGFPRFAILGKLLNVSVFSPGKIRKHNTSRCCEVKLVNTCSTHKLSAGHVGSSHPIKSQR